MRKWFPVEIEWREYLWCVSLRWYEIRVGSNLNQHTNCPIVFIYVCVFAILISVNMNKRILYVEMPNYCSDKLPTPLGTIAVTTYNKTANSTFTFTCDDHFQPASGFPPTTRCIPFTDHNGIWQNVTSACIRTFPFLTREENFSYACCELSKCFLLTLL